MKIGFDQIGKPTPKRVKAICEAIAYTLAGIATLSWAQSNPDRSVILLLAAGAIDKFAPRIFGYDNEEIIKEQDGTETNS